MNKQRFLAELRRLLVFMTESDRDLTISKYSALFDEAGEEGESAVLKQLGSPTKLAISLSRGYEPGQLTAETKQREALKKAEAAAKAAKLEHLADDSYRPGDLVLDYGIDEDDDGDDPVSIIMRSLDDAAEEERPVIEVPSELFEDEDDEDGDYDDDDDEDYRPKRSVREGGLLPGGAGAAVVALILLIVGLPLAALTLGVALLWLIPGAVGVGAALLAAIAALWCLGSIADALLVFGVAFVLLALGLLLLWCGIWLDVRLVGLYVRGVQWLCEKFLGKKVPLG